MRKSRGLTQEELADQFDQRVAPLDRMAINRIERGTRAVRLDEAIAIAYVLETGLVDLLRPTGQPIAIGKTSAYASIGNQIAGDQPWTKTSALPDPPQVFSYRQTQGGLAALWSLVAEIRDVADYLDSRDYPSHDDVDLVESLHATTTGQLDIWLHRVERAHADQVIDEAVDAYHRGDQVSLDELLAQHPELWEAIEVTIADLEGDETE